MSWIADEDDDQTWDDLFPHRIEDVGVYLYPEGLGGAMPDITFFAHIEVVVHGDETENVKILRTPEAPTENVSLPVASVEVPAPEVPPLVEVDVATTGHVSVEATQGEAAGSEVTITTSISAGND